MFILLKFWQVAGMGEAMGCWVSLVSWCSRQGGFLEDFGGGGSGRKYGVVVKLMLIRGWCMILYNAIVLE